MHAALPSTARKLAIVASSPVAVQQAAQRRRDLNIFLAVCWALSITGITMPGREAPLSLGALDPVALIKLATRGIAFVSFTVLLLRYNRNTSAPAVMRRVFPLLLFAAWAVASILWSPMQTVTIGHAFELIVLTMLTAVAAFLSTDEHDYERIFFHLTLIATIMSLLLVLLNISPILSGMRPRDYMHPNDMAKNAGAGLIMFTCCYLLWHWKWTRTILLPAVGSTALLVFAARSRTASVLTPVAMLLICFCFRKSKTVFALCLAGGLFALVLPYSLTAEHIPEAIQGYMMRGQSTQELTELSGRTEMWTIAWQSFKDSPLFGHGYYIMTKTGFFEVWGRLQWQTAHNAFLHVITGLGLMGTGFLLWALIAALRPSFCALKDRTKKVEFVALAMVVWYCAMGMFELSFFGPVDTSVVIFFVLLGISAGRPQPAPRQS